MKETLIQEYSSTEVLKIPIKQAVNSFHYSFVDGPKVEILGDHSCDYIVTFKDSKKNRIVHQAEITNNMWTMANLKYCVDWLIEIRDKHTEKLYSSHTFNPEGKKVYIHLDSNAIGDTIAWFPYIEEFRKKWNCYVVVSTFHNEWFENNYPKLEFVTPGTEVFDLYAMFSIGWFYEDKQVIKDRIPIDFKKYPLQQTASEILNLKYQEVKPIISYPDNPTDIVGNYVVIAPHASAHAKYWNYPGGWQKVIDYLNDKGYRVVMLTHEPSGDEWHDSKLGGTLQNIVDKTGNISLNERLIDIKHANAFIGVGSGLSWLSWALNTPTILISGFSYPYTEFQDCERIFTPNPQSCKGCFNKHWLNPGDWEWCPEDQNTPRQFECTKTITPEMVIKSLQKVLNIY